jgi:hypothetical protein
MAQWPGDRSLRWPLIEQFWPSNRAKILMLDCFREVVAVDFEFIATTGNRPMPVCFVAHELRSGRRFRVWRDQFRPAPPYATGPDVLFVAYYASAELGCYRVLGWPMPERILDLFVEFRARTNGLASLAGNGLLGALAYFGLDGMGANEKDEMRALILGGGPWSEDERAAILDYCESDVEALERLLPAMLPKIDLPRAVSRGRYMAAASAMEHAGVPIDTDTLELFRGHWAAIKDQLVAAIDADYGGVFEGDRHSLNRDRFAQWLIREGIPWPRHESGLLDTSDETFRQQAKIYPAVSRLRELKSSLDNLRLFDLAVGRDGRNRTILSAFGTRSSRNKPSNAKFIFGPSVWLRGLIKPPSGHAIAYIDWSQQEIGIAAALSGDQALQAAYRSGDCYLAIAKQAGAVPQDATKATHGTQRELFKTCMLGVGYGTAVIGAADRPARHRRPRSAAGAPGNLPALLAVVRGGCRPGHAPGHHPHRVWLASARGRKPKSAQSPKFSDASERRRDVAHRLLPGDRARNRNLLAGPRRRHGLRAARARRGGCRPHAGGHGRGLADRPRRLRAGHRRQSRALARPLHGPAWRRDVEPRVRPCFKGRARQVELVSVSGKFIKVPRMWEACLAGVVQKHQHIAWRFICLTARLLPRLCR